LFLIPAPSIYSINYSQNLEYAMLYRRFGFEYHYISHAIHLKRGLDFLNFFDKTARKTIRKLLRQQRLRVSESDDYGTFYHILFQNKARHGVKPTHSLEDLYRLHELVPEHLRLLMVYDGNVAIAGSLLFLCNPKVVLCFYNMMLYEYQHLHPVYLLMYEIVRWATQQGYEWVDIGVSQDTKASDPMTPALSLIRFKERFDSRGILRSTFHYRFR
ncbi:MAG: GNAT family N-acetyltransferase, partial [Candidatus Kapabacteria bacterium]|nr:GNAT family N-acetyltransferase [Candidatus Kapabacteria bacterium]MDW7997477.1 GNAT family N-acetyltransferase [Bacteroidota bacterium]